MKANELRIGNYVLDDEKNTVMIEQISGDNIHLFTQVSRRTEKGNRLIYSSNIFPIPLTEEILLKCGFEKNNEYQYLFCQNKFGYSLNEKTIALEEYKNIFLRVRTVPVEFLHQLQNLYFALAGEELTINL